jgi:uncharacterized protein YraI
MKWLTITLFTVLSMALAEGAAAANAYTQGIVHLRAGPSTDYPIVASIPPSSLLQVSGCLDDYTWCDIDWEGNRGWVYGDYLYYDYQDRRVPVLQFGASLGIGIVSFSLGDYWGRYYTGRPWYGRRNYWMHRPPPPRRPPPRPMPRPPVVHPRPPRPNPPPPRPNPSRPHPRPQPPTSGKPPPNPGGGNRPGPGGRPGNGGPPGNGSGRPGGGGPPAGGQPGGGRPGGGKPPGNGGPGNGGPGNGSGGNNGRPGGRPPPQTKPAPPQNSVTSSL